MGYPLECLCWITAVNAAYISTVEDWILQKATKEENGEMKYFIRGMNNYYLLIGFFKRPPKKKMEK